MSALPPGELARLARKYRTLGELRRARERGEPVPPPSYFKELARELPGSLHELDTLPLETLDERAALLEAAAAGGPVEPWMEWLSGYHALLRAALFIKPRVRRGAPLDDARAERLARDADPDGDLDAAFVRAIAEPPNGRIVDVVLGRLERRHGRPAAIIRRSLFPRSR